MKIDLRKLYGFGSINIDEELEIPKEYYQKTSVKSMEMVKVSGKIFINYEDNIELDLNLKSSFIIPCAITLEDVHIPFDINIDEEIQENTLKDQFSLDLLDVLWENIVLEIPIRVVKEGAKLKSQKGNGWEIITE